MKTTSLLADDIIASLHFLRSNELMFVYRQDATVHSKLVSLQDAKIAFEEHAGEDSGWLPCGVVRTGRNVRGNWVIYLAPPQVLEINTDQEEKLVIPIPMTLFLGWERRYYIWSLTGKQFRPDQEVFKAPFPNVYDNGRICWGNHKPPKVTPLNIKNTWAMFFGTTFNNHISSHKTKSHAANVLEFLRELSTAKKKKFPANELVWASRSVETCLENIFKYGGE